MHIQIPAHSAPRHCSYSRPFAVSISPLPLAPFPRSPCVLYILPGWLSSLQTQDPRPQTLILLQTLNPEP
jgi:hypothetical protein